MYITSLHPHRILLGEDPILLGEKLIFWRVEEIYAQMITEDLSLKDFVQFRKASWEEDMNN